MLTAGEADCNNSSRCQQTRFYLLPIAVTWEAGCGGAGGWLQNAEEADRTNMLPIAMPWEAGFGRRRWWLTLLAAATWEAGCGGAGSWLLWQQEWRGKG